MTPFVSIEPHPSEARHALVTDYAEDELTTAAIFLDHYMPNFLDRSRFNWDSRPTWDSGIYRLQVWSEETR